MVVQANKVIDEINQDFLEGLDNQPKENIVWDDFSFPATALKINAVTSKPDFNQTNIEYLFDDSTKETLIGLQITRHEFKNGNITWNPHVHWIQESSGTVKWELQYSIHCLGEVEPSFTTITTTSTIVSYTTGAIHQISPFPDIELTDFDTTACVVKIKISRLGADVEDTYIGDVRFFSFDFHVPIDQLGSRQIFVK